MALRMRQTILLAKIETTAGVDAVPTGAANAMLVKNIDIQPLNIETQSRDLIRPYFGNSENIPVASGASVSFDIEVAGAGAAGTAPAYAPLLKACGMGETLTASTKAEYKPVSVVTSTVTLYVNIDGVNHKLLGSRGSFSLQFTAKGFPFFRFSFLALYGGISDTTLPAATFTAFQSPVASTKANTVFGMFASPGLCIQDLSLDLANDVTKRQLITCENIVITDRKPTGSVTLEATLMADWNWPLAVQNATLGVMSLQHGTVAGNIVVIDAPKMQITSPAYSESDGLAMLRLNTVFVPNAGNDELVITVR